MSGLTPPVTHSQPRVRRRWPRAALALLLVGGWLAVGAALAPLLPGGWGAMALVATVFALLLALVVRARQAGRYPGAGFRRWVARPLWYTLLFLPPLTIAAGVGVLVGLAAGAPAFGERVGVLAMLALLIIAALVGAQGARTLVIRHVVVASPELPPPLDGVRVAQISDVHVGPHTSPRFLRRIVDAAQAESPDLIAVTGDLVDDYAGDVDAYAAGLGALKAPLGVYAIPGNHDVYAGWPEVRRRLARLPLRVLVNDAVTIVHRGKRFAVVGTGDPAGRYHSATSEEDAVAPDVARALRTVSPGTYTIALAHNPVLWPALVERGVQLTLSGHTHWGQLALPWLGWNLAGLFLERSMGAHHVAGSALYINPGTNHWGIPFRIGALPEITIVTLRHAAAASIAVGVARPARAHVARRDPAALDPGGLAPAS